MAENSSIARPYAEAAFELANAAGQLAGWSDCLQAAALAVADKALASLIDSPSTDRQASIGIITEVCARATDAPVDQSQITNLIRLLAENGRLMMLPDIASMFDSLKTAAENRVDVTLTAAQPVDEAQQARMVEALKRRFGRDINLHFKLDESLIGGARLQAGDLVIDGSIRTGLEKLSSTLTN